MRLAFVFFILLSTADCPDPSLALRALMATFFILQSAFFTPQSTIRIPQFRC